jgi:succinate dehydrogenase hydrophobic anchor subunit
MTKVNREPLTHWLLQRSTAVLLIPAFLSATPSSLIVLNIAMFWHAHIGISEILADYVHNSVTRLFVGTLIQLLILIAVKDFFVLLLLT